MANEYYVYILTNMYDTVLYIGVTNNLKRRMYEHQHKVVQGFTQKYNLQKLLYYAIFTNITEAIGYEKKLKGWKREKKILLIKKANPKFIDLSTNL